MAGRNFGLGLSLLGAAALVVIAAVGLWHRTRRRGVEVSPSSSVAQSATAATKASDIPAVGVTDSTPTKATAAAVSRKEISSSTTAVSSTQDPRINLHCLVNHIQNAPAPFHWSFQKSAQSYSSDWEARITRNSIRATVSDKGGKRAIQGVRSNSNSWNTAVQALTSPLSGAVNTVALVEHSSAVTRAGAETLNGIKTVHYLIDTGKDTSTDASLMSGILGRNGFIRGAAWVTADGCPVKFTLDTQMQLPNGGVQNEHYQSLVTAAQ